MQSKELFRQKLLTIRKVNFDLAGNKLMTDSLNKGKYKERFEQTIDANDTHEFPKGEMEY